MYLFALATPYWGFSQPVFSKEQQEVFNTSVIIGQAWTENNIDTLEKYIAKDYLHTDVRGHALRRAAWFNYVKDRKAHGLGNPGLRFEDVEISINGDFAFITGTNVFTGAAYVGNDSNDNHKLRFTQVLRRENKIWKRILFQATYVVAKE
ncbi:hypothetical protein BH10BAC4_BH10BAC4_06780 [soil metagenome]